MRSRVSYDPDLKNLAAGRRNGLYTIDLINASKKPGKFGSRWTMQGPATEKQHEVISRFMLQMTKEINGKA